MSTLPSKAGWAALWSEDAGGADAFWDLYSGILTLIARSRDASGHRYFEANKITRLYEEVIQAAVGSRWVWALTFASGIEALVNLLEPRGHPRSEPEAEAAEDLAAKIADLDGDARLKSIAQAAVRRATKVSSVDNMRRLRDERVVTGVQLDAWTQLRNRVAHGSLISVYNNKEEDGQLLALAGMFHALTRALIDRGSLRP